MSNINALIIGLGSAGTRHARNLKSLGVKNIFSISNKKRRKKFNLSFINYYKNLNLILKKKEIHIAIISNPSSKHLSIAKILSKKKIDLFDSSITLIDSAGIQKKVSSFNDNITEFTLESASKSDLIMFVVDGSSGLSSADYEINNIIKKFKIKKILIVNKSEGKLDSFVQDDCSKLGIGEPLFVSAVHKMGIYELKSKIYKILDLDNKSNFFKENNFDHSISIVGRPNSGKESYTFCLIYDSEYFVIVSILLITIIRNLASLIISLINLRLNLSK